MTAAGDGRGSWRRAALWAALAAAATGGCFDDAGETASTGFQDLNADEVLYGVHHNMTTDGVREALLGADSLFGWRDSSHTWAMGFSLRVFEDGTGVAQATITAERGRLDMSRNELKAVGNAVLSIPNQDREIRTEELYISPNSNRIWSDVKVVMREAGCEVEGSRFESDMSFREVKIWHTREGDCPGQ